ncbi:hypothetical protein [Novosphingobium humi]|uniref:Uncharacterized protein n=1 Tax=Novosphingobium humi TaxID=2282397 RepID=A0ABY7TTJ4_9SPHN|nr:hypothetical protein [Novosphingobium humi]WCT75927.1 hypothetical protein PQ457_08085 [Novosphingobium humi]
MSRNQGGMPGMVAGKRVHVRLRNGYDTRNAEPMGWAADGRSGCRWNLLGSPFDIVEWELIG